MYGAGKGRLKPRILMVTSTSSTTFVDKTYRGRLPCGRYHRARILHTTLRTSLPRFSAESSNTLNPTTTTADMAPGEESSEEDNRPPHSVDESSLSYLRRLFSFTRAKSNPPEPKRTLRPLVLPDRLGLGRSRSASTPPSSGSHEAPSKDAGHPPAGYLAGFVPHHVRRISMDLAISLVNRAEALAPPQLTSLAATTLGHVQPYMDLSVSTIPRKEAPVPQLRPLVLARQTSMDASDLIPPPTENANMLAWLLDCIQRDLRPQWAAGPVRTECPRMVLGNGQPRCLVMRGGQAKRRSALF